MFVNYFRFGDKVLGSLTLELPVQKCRKHNFFTDFNEILRPCHKMEVIGVKDYQGLKMF